VTGATQLPDEVEAVPVPRGRYRVRVVYAQTDHRPAKFNSENAGDHLEHERRGAGAITMTPRDAYADSVSPIGGMSGRSAWVVSPPGDRAKVRRSRAAAGQIPRQGTAATVRFPDADLVGGRGRDR
jgi:hypothetical protein